ncbi:MAG: SPOR domain-containing protein [Gemmatimonadaceae bacterium]
MALVATLGVALPGAATGQAVQLAAQVSRLIAAGNNSAARALVDSTLVMSAAGSSEFIETLYWKAVLDTTAAGAEHYHLRVVVEYPWAARASESLLRLAELEIARNERVRARQHLNQLRDEYPQSREFARASYLAARLALQDLQQGQACSMLADAFSAVDSNEVELRNQIGYMRAGCTMTGARDSAARTDSLVTHAARASLRDTTYTIQVAAYNTAREATVLARQLQRRGLPSRVVGSRAPFRVRVGRYENEAAARTAMRRNGLRGIVVTADPP